ncbi:MAG: alpha-glucosidase, partial [Pseudomonadota bacterium]
LRGTSVLYQGEELGLPEADVPYERIVDPYGLTFFPDFKGRDGCRTPMPWTDFDPHAGFSTVEGWLPIPNDHIERAVAAQEVDQTSVLTFTRAFLRWRRSQPVLLTGALEFVDAPSDMLVFIRRATTSTGASEPSASGILIAFNFGHAAVSARFDDLEITHLLDVPGQRGSLLRAAAADGDPATGPITGLRVPGNSMLFAVVR